MTVAKKFHLVRHCDGERVLCCTDPLPLVDALTIQRRWLYVASKAGGVGEWGWLEVVPATRRSAAQIAALRSAHKRAAEKAQRSRLAQTSTFSKVLAIVCRWLEKAVGVRE